MIMSKEMEKNIACTAIISSMNQPSLTQRIVFVDNGFLMFRSIFLHDKMRQVPSTYTYMRMLLSNLVHIGLHPEDTVVIAIDSPKGSWRRDLDSQYKADRKEKREASKIDWEHQFKAFNNLLEKLDMATPWHCITIDRLEADDIIAYGCKKFKDKECIIISSDSDYEQLTAYDNVKVFSPISKRYKHVKDPYLLIQKKIKSERADNLISPVLNEKDWAIRYALVNLLQLPKEVEDSIDSKLSYLPEKDWDFDIVPYNSLRKNYENVYRQDKVVAFGKQKPKKRRKRL